MIATVSDQAHLLSLLEATLDATAEGLLVVDIQGKIVVSNRRFAELWQIPSAIIAEQNDEHLLAFVMNQVANSGEFLNKVHEVYANREKETFDILELVDGRAFARSSKPQRVNGDIVGTVWSFRDITSQRRAEAITTQALAHEKTARTEAEGERRRAELLSETSKILARSLDYEATLKAISEVFVPNLGDWIILAIKDGESGIRLASVATNPERSKLAKSLQDCIPDPNTTEGISRVFKTGEAVLYAEITAAHLTVGPACPTMFSRDEECMETIRSLGMHSYMVVPMNVRGETIGVIGISSANPSRLFNPVDLDFAEDLAQRCAIAIDSARLYRDALRTIQVREDFLSVASHELRTPLSPLRMQFEMAEVYATELPTSIPNREQLLKLLAGAGIQVERLLRLVDNLLDVSRITAGHLNLHPERFDLVILISEIATRFKMPLKNAGCELQLELPSELFGKWDKSRIEQVLLNLLTNAIKFGSGGQIEISLTSKSKEALLSVRDHGIGIGPEDISRIFQRFERAAPAERFQGLGLGLYITSEIVEAHSGKISVESKLGHGTCFTVRLPLPLPLPA